VDLGAAASFVLSLVYETKVLQGLEFSRSISDGLYLDRSHEVFDVRVSVEKGRSASMVVKDRY
jgi:hypothetical protein